MAPLPFAVFVAEAAVRAVMIMPGVLRMLCRDGIAAPSMTWESFGVLQPSNLLMYLQTLWRIASFKLEFTPCFPVHSN